MNAWVSGVCITTFWQLACWAWKRIIVSASSWLLWRSGTIYAFDFVKLRSQCTRSFLIVQDDGKETHCWIDWEIKTPVRLRLVLLIEFYLYWSNRKLILNNLLPMTRVFKGRCLASFPNFCPDGFVFWTIAKSSIMVRVSFTLLVMQSMGLEPNWYY